MQCLRSETPSGVSQEPSRAAVGFGTPFLTLVVFLSSCPQSIRVPEQSAVPRAPDPQGGCGQ